ncbi:SMC family ATPase [Streptomyces sp. SCSIO 30461]|uniref:SMC family ATPase n=1 Tax=Streptomyces sp. SCSIO 30461 TaxID=3118085 RepID=UPI0030D04EC2
MRLHRLALTAFGPFGDRQEVDFDTLSTAGLFLLHGPTGAGKTSVLDAVCYALYGSVPGDRQNPGASLRSDHAVHGTSTEVCLELTVAGRRLEITRRPAQTRPKLRGTGFTTEKAQSGLREYDRERGEWKPLSRSHQEIGEEITQLLGMSREQFCQVVLLPQGDFARFLRADAEARGRLLGRLFDTRRFAAVEERLAELRRGAEQQVREGDERLLGVAHRMAQAAGGAGRDRSAPDGRPGDPGLAVSVLDWAAVARTDARESLDIAVCALDAAEIRRQAAGRALDEARELARLQGRHAETRGRLAELKAAEPERDRVKAVLDGARKAELVSPALRLRDDAEREHRSARSEWELLRRSLPGSLADAGGERLSALERELRQELGGLDAARRAEARGTELRRERAESDRQSRADEELLRDADTWLAGWEALRGDLQTRLDTARDAATRAEHLAGRLDRALRREAAGRERDRLADRATALDTALRAARDQANGARELWLDLKERRLLGIAAELASGLRQGTPCAVCGSSEHPAPARAEEQPVDRAHEGEAYEAYTTADAKRADTERELAVVHETLAATRRTVRELAPAPSERTQSGSAGTDGVTGVVTTTGCSAVPAAAADGASGAEGAAAGLVPRMRRPECTEEASSDALRGPAAAAIGRIDVPSGPDVFRPGPTARVCEAETETEVNAETGVDAETGVEVGARAGVSVPAATGAEGPSGPEPGMAELAGAVERLEREHREAQLLAMGIHDAREALHRAEREHAGRLAERQAAERRAASRTSRREALDGELAAIDAEVDRATAGAGSVAEQVALLERRISLLAAAADAARVAEDTAQRLKAADDRLSDAAYRAGYRTPADAASALLGDAEQHELQRRLDAWQREAAAVADRLAEAGTRAAAERPPADLEAAQRVHTAAERALHEAASALASARERGTEVDRLSGQAAAEVRRLGPLREEYDRLARLAALATGTSGENERRMRLESYVLAARLEQVAAAATSRLQRMSAGRYSLVHSDARAGGKRAGLGLHVVDAWTGRERDTATLSGGETFFASLALALGLADVVTDEAGGVRLDTLFIDEGFGSLDDQTLDEVLDVLDSLRERDRSVGIVSHVADLRRRVPVQLEVLKERHGSRVRLRMTPLRG